MRRFSLVGVVVACAFAGGCGTDPPPPPPSRPPDPEAGALIFQEKCANCHTIGAGMRTGPDLHGVMRLRQREWVLRIMKDPIGMTKTDPVARELLARANNVPMPPSGLTDDQIADVLAFVEQETARVPPPPPSPTPSLTPTATTPPSPPPPP